MKFKNNEHRDFFDWAVAKDNSQADPYRRALFYALGLTDETRRNIEDLYSFRERVIRIGGLTAAWQTSTSERVTRLAFNLFNNFSEEDVGGSGEHYTPEDLFADGLMEWMFEAVRQRYPEYTAERQEQLKDIFAKLGG